MKILVVGGAGYVGGVIVDLLLLNKNRLNTDVIAYKKFIPTLKELIQIGITFSLTVFAWIFFRANNIRHAISYISEILSPSLFTTPKFKGIMESIIIIILVIVFVLIEWKGREGKYAIAHLGIKRKRYFRYALYYAIILAIFLFGGKEQQFIYFQF